MSRAGSSSSLFKAKHRKQGHKSAFYLPAQVILLDISCFFRMTSQNGQQCIEFMGMLLYQFQACAPDARVCIFDLLNRTEIVTLVKSKIPRDIIVYSETSLEDVIGKVPNQGSIAEKICIMTMKGESHLVMPSLRHQFYEVSPAGGYHEDEFEALKNSLHPGKPYTICVDIDNTAILDKPTEVLGERVLNNTVLQCIQQLSSVIEIEEILFLTARPSDIAEELVSEEAALAVLGKSPHWDAQLVARDMNQSLKTLGLTPIKRIVYANYKKSEDTCNKYQFLKALHKKNRQGLLIENSPFEILALQQSGNCAEKNRFFHHLRILEQHELTESTINAMATYLKGGCEESTNALDSEESQSQCLP